jgi:outer membrane protein assembly factor BamB
MSIGNPIGLASAADKGKNEVIMSRVSLVFSLLLVTFAGQSRAEDWPGWRGVDRTDVSRETGLLKEWPEGGPKRAWLSKDCGIGYSGFAVVDGKLYTLGAYENTEELVCLDANTGKYLWGSKISDNVLDNGWGDGPRGTPTVDGDNIYALSGRGDLVCATKDKGKVVWSANMRDFGGSVPNWGYAESVLIDGDKLICTPGGRDGAIVSLEKLTGKKIWQSKDFTDGANYSSEIVAENDVVRQ